MAKKGQPQADSVQSFGGYVPRMIVPNHADEKKPFVLVQVGIGRVFLVVGSTNVLS